MKVCVTRAIPDRGLALLREANIELNIWPNELPPKPDELRELVSECDGILSLLSDKIDAHIMDSAGPQLKVISNFAVGYNNIDVKEARRRGIKVGNTPDVLTEATADLAFALLISSARRLGEAQKYVKDGAWQTWRPLGHIGQDLKGKTLGIFGMGRIGAALAQRCVGGWGMKVIYCSRTQKPECESRLNVQRVDFKTLLKTSDFISVHAPLTPETKHIFNRKAFNLMKDHAVFVNTARGGLHHQTDLYEALESGQIFAAGLDVTDPEPMSANEPLLSLPNCIVLPHIGSGTISSREAMSEIAAENIICALSKQALRCEV